MIEILKAVFLGIVQGITEWLPISSTGHMILVNEFLPMGLSAEFMSMFFVVIQFGSILAVLVLYFEKLNPISARKSPEQRRDTLSLWLKVLIAVIPAGVVGIAFEEKIDAYFFNPQVVAAALILYGIFFIILESRKKQPRIHSFEELSYTTALLIGVFQVLALIPGTSRSGSTILGAILLGSSRGVATEFSFFLAIPVMLGASALKLLNFGLILSGLEWAVLLVGMTVAFLVSIIAIKFLVGYIKRHDFKAFGYYRIVLGSLIVLYFAVLG